VREGDRGVAEPSESLWRPNGVDTNKTMKYAQILEYARSLRKNQTKAEAVFWEQVRNRRFNGLKFTRQFIIEYENDQYFIADFHCHELKLIVELDGGIHKSQIEYDLIREDILLELGYELIRFQNEEVLKDWTMVEEKMVNLLNNSPQPSLAKGGNLPSEKKMQRIKISEGSVESSSPSLVREGDRGVESLKKIAIIGPESTGKSDLAKGLAQHYQTTWVPEYARDYIEALDRPYDQEDLLRIAKGQIALEDEKAKEAVNYLFCDTNLIVLKIWSDHKYGETHPWILESLANRTYDFYLLSDIDIPWQADPQREHPHMREYFFNLYQDYLIENKLAFGLVTGLGPERIKQALKLIEDRIS
jgi:very-short-patch-repair endonuclease/nicotinamide riboside kinase